MSAPFYIALVHHPVRDKTGAVVTTAITNLDVHDLARTAKTYGAAGYFVVTPVTAQRRIVEAILAHWREGPGLRRVPQRGEALALVRPVQSIAEALEQIGRPATVVATAARSGGRPVVPFAEEAARLRRSEQPTLLLFGTGHGLADEVLDAADRLLEPIRGGGYNHLSVRAAVAIALDRLWGER